MIPCIYHNTNIDSIIDGTVVGSTVSIYQWFCKQKTSKDGKFLYVLSSELLENWNPAFEWLGKIKLSDNVQKAVKNKRAVILIDITLESLSIEEFKPMWEKFQKLNNFDHTDQSNIIYLTSNINFPNLEGCTVIKDHFVLAAAKNIWFTGYHKQRNEFTCMIDHKIKTIANNRIKENWTHKFVCLQQRPRKFRKELYKKLRKDFDKNESICTLRKDDEIGFVEVSPYDSFLENEHIEWHQINEDHFSYTKYSVVSERNYYNNECAPFTTEKVLKNLILPQPFVLCSYKNHIKELKKLGFKIYDDLIDHSYDSYDDDKRMDAVINELKRVLNITPDLYTEQAKFNCDIIKNNQIFEDVFKYISKILDIQE